eukprot:CAMPEP_0115135588 /NCGR_PEP_ID=MMETSP0227-20121206/55822_1 /TAXON_ID=89957 /ORGANISM="Polarella glacialis, Strain CCMP 1383" /LENGTH=91 /DNA_ID=CAMNT_0002542369 /DNA_START=233 /DNA_END=506 /DNA_ORIENTATION=+
MKKQGLHEDQLVAMQVSPRSLRHMQLPCDSLEEEALWHPQPMAPGRLRILDSWSDSCSSANPEAALLAAIRAADSLTALPLLGSRLLCGGG